MPDFIKLAHCPVFWGVDAETLEFQMKDLSFQVRRYAKEEVVATMGQRIEALVIVQKGTVRGEMMDYSGKVLKIEDIEAPRPLAAAFLFGNNNHFPVTVIANDDVEIVSLPTREFLLLMQRNQTILVNYLNTISSRSQFLTQKLHFLSFRNIRGKIAHFLLQEAGTWLHSIELKQTQQQLADLFGVTRPALARVLGEMQREGIISMERKTIQLLDKPRLNQLLKND